MKEEIFVTYAWGTEEDNHKVYSLVERLRIEGFNATCDVIKMQEQTAINFKEMMQKGLTQDKVIIVLSEGYKKKADEFKDGVGTEYRTVINDIEENENKYILVSFCEVTNETLKSICPYMLKGRYVINLNKKEALNELFAKIKGEAIFEFSEVSPNEPEIERKKIQPLSFEEKVQGLNSNKQYVDEAREFIKSLGISISSGSYSERKGTNLNTGIEELEEGKVLVFSCDDFDVVDNNIWYYYNVKNQVLYKYENNKFEKMLSTSEEHLNKKQDIREVVVEEFWDKLRNLNNTFIKANIDAMNNPNSIENNLINIQKVILELIMYYDTNKFDLNEFCKSFEELQNKWMEFQDCWRRFSGVVLTKEMKEELGYRLQSVKVANEELIFEVRRRF